MNCPNCFNSPPSAGCSCNYQNNINLQNQMQAQNQSNIYGIGMPVAQWKPLAIEDFLHLSYIKQYYLDFKQAKISKELFRTLLKLANAYKTIDNLEYLEFLDMIKESYTIEYK